ncbi:MULTISPECIES: S9 family peptidase [unclassified Meiothermus]|uniref:alpha/beta hydrolase family protein n=1 Tax=unclassified Meiothermus TaxID=370471 RepID=UPI000D7C7A6C|nr:MULTISPECIES: alpha/beta fold hydrolase [unclassified Meiothermus]PZA07008.1 dienelactone hydrolase [Meiothermus sp. Pnk-1]RYM35290.1 alpha/beta fold hydrolase [Meiothermus sp. PNK-Is4]
MRLLLIGVLLAGNLCLAQSGLAVDDLAKRSYGGGRIAIERVLERNPDFTRYLIRYPSDDLTLYGFMNVPTGKGPYPVVLVLHGYVNPATYRTLAYTTRYADALARMGYVVLHPNYRGHPPSEGKPDPPFRIGYAVDVLNLLAIVRAQAGQPGPLEKADGGRLALFGHSMGGGIALRVAVVDPRVRVVVLYGSMSGDEAKNAQRIYYVFSGRQRGQEELRTPASELARISPINYLSRTQAAFSVHHGTADPQVPYAWSVELCQKLKALGKRTECFGYAGAGHLFQGRNDQVFLQRVQAFFARTLKGADSR